MTSDAPSSADPSAFCSDSAAPLGRLVAARSALIHLNRALDMQTTATLFAAVVEHLDELADLVACAQRTARAEGKVASPHQPHPVDEYTAHGYLTD